jgi:DNA-binding PucR family transcriptional regulator
VVTYRLVAPVAMMLGSADLLYAWVRSTLGGLTTDDEHHARLRSTLLVFLQTGGSYKTTTERLVLHKNTVQYRIRKAQESLGRPVGSNATMSSSRCRPPTGSAQPCSSRPGNDRRPRLALPRQSG